MSRSRFVAGSVAFAVAATATLLAGACSKEPAAPAVEPPKITIDPAELTAFSPLPDEVPAAGGAATDDAASAPREGGTLAETSDDYDAALDAELRRRNDE